MGVGRGLLEVQRTVEQAEIDGQVADYEAHGPQRRWPEAMRRNALPERLDVESDVVGRC
jgi:hypothetical protein